MYPSIHVMKVQVPPPPLPAMSVAVWLQLLSNTSDWSSLTSLILNTLQMGVKRNIDEIFKIE